MTRPPLTTNGSEILRMHHAGVPHDHITYLGWCRGSWTAADVAQVVADWGHPDRETLGSNSVNGPTALPREHGSSRGYYQHRKYKEEACDECRAARRTPDDQRKPRPEPTPKTEKPKRVRGVDSMASCCWYRQRVLSAAESDLTTATYRAIDRQSPKNLATLEAAKAQVEIKRQQFEEHLAACTAGAA